MSQKIEDEMEDWLFEAERRQRHSRVCAASDVMELRESLYRAAIRFADLADIVDEKGSYSDSGFLRASARRYLRASGIKHDDAQGIVTEGQDPKGLGEAEGRVEPGPKDAP